MRMKPSLAPRMCSRSRWAVVVAVLVLMAPIPGGAMQQREWRAVDRAIAGVHDTTLDSIPISRERHLWQSFDAAVLAALRSGTSVDSINGILARRHGYSGPSGGQPTASVGGATFWRELPRDAPTYYVAPVEPDRDDVLVGVFQVEYLWANGPSHVSIYSRSAQPGSRWIRSAGFTSDRQIELYRIPSDSGAPILATFETWTRADGSQAELKLWRLDGTSLVRVPRVVRDTALFQDLDVEVTQDALVLRSLQFPRYVSACAMCARLALERTLRVAQGRIAESVVSDNPWVTLVDSLYGLLGRGRITAARAMLPFPGLAKRVLGLDPDFHSDTGSMEAGRGNVVVHVGSNPDGAWRFESRRGADGVWRIVAVQPGRWRNHAYEFGPALKP